MRSRPTTTALLALILASILGSAACSDDSSGGASDVGADPDAAGDADTAPDAVPDVPIGDPLEADPLSWTFVPFDDALCGNGDTAGLAVNMNPDSDRLLVFLEGGGWCWNDMTCTLDNPNVTTFTFTGITEESVLDILESEKDGVLNRDADDNPFADYNLVYVPYCTGDMHFGRRVNDDDGVTHVGALNVQAYLARIVATWPDAAQVVLTGVSAGGYGAFLNYDQVRQAFGDGVPVHLLADSSPPFPESFAPDGFVDAVIESWGLELPAGCTDCSDFEDLRTYYAETYTADRQAFVASAVDWLLRRLWASEPDGTLGEPVPEQDYFDAIVVLTEAMDTAPQMNAYVDDSDQHVFNDKEVMFRTVANEVSLTSWLADFESGASEWGSVVEPYTPPTPLPAPGSGITVDDEADDEAYSYPMDSTFNKQQDILSLNVSVEGAVLQLVFTLAEVTTVWGPANGFDHVAFTVFFDNPDESGLTVLPQLQASAPDGFEWNLAHRTHGWGSEVYGTDGADADTRGNLLELGPVIEADADAGTVSLLYDGAEIGLDSWAGFRVYATTWDIDGSSDTYRAISSEGGDFEYGGGESGDPKIMDDLPPIEVPLALSVDDDADDEAYSYPQDATFNQQQDILGADVLVSFDQIVLTLEMAEVTDGWSPVNGFDHVAFTLFVDLPGSDGATALPKLNASMPDSLDWDRMVLSHGWGNDAYSADGATADDFGASAGPAPSLSADAEAGLVSFFLSSDLLGGVDDFSGATLYVTIWDFDGISNAYRELSEAGGQWVYGGGAADDPKVMDDLLIAIP